jgi:membrane-associated PAP2 superfamily phosphatase
MRYGKYSRAVPVKTVLRIGIPAAILLAVTLIIWGLDADIRLARLVYGENGPWPGIDRFPWDFLYRYAPYPAFIMAGISLVMLVGGFFVVSLKKFRIQSLFFILLLLLGPGLVVNTILKDNVGRARPRELVEFGGSHRFSQVWQPGDTGRNSSFPSGHAAVAFYLMAPWFILRGKKRIPAVSVLVSGLAFGSLVGATRILQGAHFLSDVVWAGGLVYITGEVVVLLLKIE